jgi:dihydropteroate synthase
VPAAEEIDRVVPVVEAVASQSDVVISVDTFRPEVAEAAISAGASVINDTTGIHDGRLADVVAASDATLVITHSLAAPRQPAPHPRYDDVAREVAAFLRDRVDFALSRGIPEDRLIIDPGHDLNKNTVQTLELTRRLAEVTTLGFPTLAAVSNKDFIGESLDRDKQDRLAGTLAAATVSAMLGARILRVHQVREAVDATRMVEAILGWRLPAHPVHNL